MNQPPEIQDIPLRVLSKETLEVLSLSLNPFCETLMPGCDKVGDYRGLAELYGKSTPYIMFLENKTDPTRELLGSLTGRDATISSLWRHLCELGRTDILDKCTELFRQDIKRWHNRKPRDAFEAEEIKNEKRRSKIKSFFGTRKSDNCSPCEDGSVLSACKPEVVPSVMKNDVKTVKQGESNKGSRNELMRTTELSCRDKFKYDEPRGGHDSNGQSIQSSQFRQTDQSEAGANNNVITDHPGPILAIDDIGNERPHYDAFIICAMDDIIKAKEMLDILEKPPYNLRLFLPDRQLMPGGSMYEDSAAVVEERCHGKVVIILTRNYIDSEACQFVTNFARALDPASQSKKIIPIMYERIVIPRMLRGLHLINKENDERRGWFWSKLNTAIKQ